jgi:hypothetical protein
MEEKDFATRHYAVLKMSKDFHSFAENKPELWFEQAIANGSRMIKGAEVVMIAASPDEIKDNMDTVIANFDNPELQRMMIVETIVHCPLCFDEVSMGKKPGPCQHHRASSVIRRGRTIDLGSLIKNLSSR